MTPYRTSPPPQAAPAKSEEIGDLSSLDTAGTLRDPVVDLCIAVALVGLVILVRWAWRALSC